MDVSFTYNDLFHEAYLPSLFCLYFVISQGCQMKSGINVLIILILGFYLICWNLVYWIIKSILLLLCFLIVQLVNLKKVRLLPFSFEISRATHSFEIIHSDVWGINPLISHAQYKYFVIFIDDYNRYTWVYFLQNKSEFFHMFKLFLALVDIQFSVAVKILWSDSGGEYMSHEFQSFLQSKCIISQCSCPLIITINLGCICSHKYESRFSLPCIPS